MADEILTRELVRHVLGKFGLVPPPHLGKVGVSPDEFKLPNSLDIEYVDDLNHTLKSSFPLWCGEANMGKGKLVVLATDLFTEDEKYHEFCATFCVDDMAVHGVKHIFSDHEEAQFLISRDKKEWSQMGVYEKLLVTAGLERLADLGAKWIPRSIDNHKDLYAKLVDLVEM